MRWFKRRPLPFDDHFSIHIETPPDPSPANLFSFTIPDWYYAHLITLQCDATFNTIPIADPARNLQGYVYRGSSRIYAWSAATQPKSGSSYHVILFHRAHQQAYNTPAPPTYQGTLPAYLYLYPGDILHYVFSAGHVTDTLTNFVLTFKIWEI